ncbi:hypothetical protein [Bremerella sp.]|uniref:hypothetical protein n=1 Tax=Bremerella sp. TaxID=2795602 RepID=UPI00391B9D42
MKPVSPTVTFFFLLPIGVISYLIGTPWQLAVAFGLYFPLLFAYMSLVTLSKQHQLSWKVSATHWHMVLLIPLFTMVLGMISLTITFAFDLPELYFMIALGIFATGSLLIAIAGCVVLILDLLGKIPLKGP